MPNDYYNRRIDITKSDTVNFDGTVFSSTGVYNTTTGTRPIPCEAIYVGGTGIVVAVLEDGTKPQFTAAVGEILPVKAIRVDSTTTSATLMVALYQV